MRSVSVVVQQQLTQHERTRAAIPHSSEHSRRAAPAAGAPHRPDRTASVMTMGRLRCLRPCLGACAELGASRTSRELPKRASW